MKFYLRFRSLPGVNPKPPFSLILDLTACVACVLRHHDKNKSWRSKTLALIWHRALTWYSLPARPFATPDDPLLVTGQQGSPFPACRQLSRAQNACAGSSSKESTKLKHGTKLGANALLHSPTRRSTAAPWAASTEVRVGRHIHLDV